MGNRTVVILPNDHQHKWSEDPRLGEKIAEASTMRYMGREHYFEYGQVVESEHMDAQTLMVVDGLHADILAYSHWRQDQTKEDRNVNLLKLLAEQLGYRVVKKTVKEQA